ncbi:MAG: sigma 54-interacting transcriptional regulator, partial [Microbacterium sp.]|nr:sigma 54-interacting transcriptional regulator [Microbacterium sp.]
VDVRVVCATNRDLRDMVANDLFREDLFFRLNTFEIILPPLRDRRHDVPELARLDPRTRSRPGHGRDIRGGLVAIVIGLRFRKVRCRDLSRPPGLRLRRDRDDRRLLREGHHQLRGRGRVRLRRDAEGEDGIAARGRVAVDTDVR